MTEQTDSNVPKIRFKGFNKGWEAKTLGDLGSFKNGMNFGKEAMGHGNPFVNLQNVFGQFEVDDKKLELAESSNLQRREYNLLKGDILFIRSSVKPEGVGETALITKTLMDTTYSGFIIRYRPEVMMAHDFNRIAYRTSIVRKQILANASRSANTNINQNALKKIALRIPCFKEQTQIGEYFRELDSLIGLHQRKHDKLVTLKKAMLQKMFPQAGATTPEIRFKGFFGAWVKRKLDEIGEFNPKETLPETFEYVDLESVVGTEMVNHRTETRNTAPSRAQRLARQGDFFFQTVRPYQKNNYLFVLPLTNYVFSTGYAQIRPFDDGSFLLGLMQREQFVKVVLDHCTGTSYPAINSKVLAEILVSVPTPEEQKKIGTYFRQLDALISQHASQLQKLKQIKSACLEKMFV